MKNNTSDNIVFPVPNTLHFRDIKSNKSISVPQIGGFPPITVYAVIESQKLGNNYYQRKLDSTVNSYFIQKGMPDLMKEWKSGDGHSTFLLKKDKSLQIKYRLVIKPLPETVYSSKYKQIYYPYNKVLKSKDEEGEYLRLFSGLNFGRAKFIAQPKIKDSLILEISEKNYTK